jgi:chorismate-pyruvate lyase
MNAGEEPPAHRNDDSALDDIGLVQRLLLATDGTLTHILEAYLGERVSLVKLHQSLVTDPVDRDRHELDDGERALHRVILLQGSGTRATCVFADSLMLLDRLHPLVADGLLETDTPIGKLLWKCRTETFREITDVWERHDDDIAAHFGLGATDPLVSRKYQIVEGGRPIAIITETFPKLGFPSQKPA